MLNKATHFYQLVTSNIHSHLRHVVRLAIRMFVLVNFALEYFDALHQNDIIYILTQS